MNIKLIMSLALLGFLTACASTHPGSEGRSLNTNWRLPLKVSAQTIDDARGEAFQLIEVTLENVSESWVKVNRTQVVINNPAESKLSVVLGKDLKDWAQAMKFRLMKDEHNRQMLQLGLATAGAVASASGTQDNNSALAVAGAVTLIGTYAWAVTDTIQQSYKSAEQSEKVPENHLYQSFSVPGKMFLRRWVLLNKPSQSLIRTFVLELETIEGEKDTYEVSL